MTTDEIRALVAQKIAGQGSAVDVGGGLPTILNAICDALDAIPAPYTLPRASDTVLGGIKVGKLENSDPAGIAPFTTRLSNSEPDTARLGFAIKFLKFNSFSNYTKEQAEAALNDNAETGFIDDLFAGKYIAIRTLDSSNSLLVLTHSDRYTVQFGGYDGIGDYGRILTLIHDPDTNTYSAAVYEV